MLHLALLDYDTPKFVSGLYFFFFFLVLEVSEYLSIFHTSTDCQCFDLHFGVLREWGASGCLNSRFAIGELLRGAAEFTLRGQGPFLFAWVQCEHLGHPPARIH